MTRSPPFCTLPTAQLKLIQNLRVSSLELRHHVVMLNSQNRDSTFNLQGRSFFVLPPTTLQLQRLVRVSLPPQLLHIKRFCSYSQCIPTTSSFPSIAHQEHTRHLIADCQWMVGADVRTDFKTSLPTLTAITGTT